VIRLDTELGLPPVLREDKGSTGLTHAPHLVCILERTRRFLLYWTLVSALSRNHWGMGRFCLAARAKVVLVRKVLLEG